MKNKITEKYCLTYEGAYNHETGENNLNSPRYKGIKISVASKNYIHQELVNASARIFENRNFQTEEKEYSDKTNIPNKIEILSRKIAELDDTYFSVIRIPKNIACEIKIGELEKEIQEKLL